MPVSLAFTQAYQRLNPAQKNAVDTIEGPVMVLAGPGTGKTQVLAARIAHILEVTDTEPSAILALTFTESAAKNMRQRLVELIGPTGYYVRIGTFHSFCQQVLSAHPEFFLLDRDSAPLSDLEKYSILEELLETLPLEVLRPLNKPFLYLYDLLRAISDLKREAITIEALEKLIQQEKSLTAEDFDKAAEWQKHQKVLAKHQELKVVYAAYQAQLEERQRYDFDDMIAFVAKSFSEEPTLLAEYQENTQYVLVDEYQDTNASQNQIVDLLAQFWGEQANIFVVGDPHQAIYRFQGASLENVVGFVDRYPSATVITLDQGYRCPQPVYDAAAALIAHNTSTAHSQLPLAQQLQSQQETSALIEVAAYPSQSVELVGVAERIKELLAQKVSAAEIAVLYRHNRDAAALAEVLAGWGIPFEIDGGSDALKEPVIQQWLTLLRVVASLQHGQEDEELFEVLRYPWMQLSSLMVLRLGRVAGKNRESLLTVIDRGWEYIREQDHLPELSKVEFEAVAEKVELLRYWASTANIGVIIGWLEQLLRESELLSWIKDQPAAAELLTAIWAWFSQVKALVTRNHDLNLTQLLQAMATLQEHGITLPLEDLNITQTAVKLSTVHKAKGQEWEYVFIVHCLDGKWGNASKREMLPLPAGILRHTDLSEKERNEDDRRLLYVAMTRAKIQVRVSYPETITSDARTKVTTHSMFVAELLADVPALIKQVDVLPLLSRSQELLEKLLQPATVVSQSSISSQHSFFTALLSDFTLSVSALNSYLRDPALFVEQHLLRLPKVTTDHMAFGTAVHAALEALYRPLTRGEAEPELKYVLSVFRQALSRELITSTERDRRQAFGEKILTEYYNQGIPAVSKPLFVERLFGGKVTPVVWEGISLTGRVDRVDWIEEASKTVRVIDYKTGAPKTGGYIEGTLASMELSERERALPEPIRGPYKRQLLFYKLLADVDPSFTLHVTEGVFMFVQPNATGKLVERRYPLLSEEVALLQTLIQEVMAEITALDFLSEL